MAWRVTNEEVRAILNDDASINLAPFIETATALTDRVAAKDVDSVLTDAILKEIERYLAAHFYSLRDPAFTEKKTGDASAVFYGKTGMGFEYTPYGRTARDLDETGFLESLGRKRQKISLDWMGLPPSEQTDYVDRD